MRELLPRIDALSRRSGSERTRAIVELMHTATENQTEFEEHATKALRLCERVRDRPLMCTVLSRLSILYMSAGAWDDARAVLDRAGSIYPRFTLGAIYYRRARTEYETGNAAGGDAIFHEYLDAYATSDERDIFDYTFLIELIALRIRIAKQKEHIKVAEEIARKILESSRASMSNRYRCTLWLGFFAAVSDDQSHAADFLCGLERLQARSEPSNYTIVKGIVAEASGDLGRAKQFFKDGMAHLRRSGNTTDLAWACLEYAKFLARRGGRDSSERISELALIAETAAKELDMPPLGAQVDAFRASLDTRFEISPGLTRRESEVLLHLSRGKTNQEISRDLGISEHTVAHHVSAIFRKIGVTNRVDAAVYATGNSMHDKK